MVIIFPTPEVVWVVLMQIIIFLFLEDKTLVALSKIFISIPLKTPVGLNKDLKHHKSKWS